jgi:rod shape-determining protein MreC
MRDYLDDRPIKLRRERTGSEATTARPLILALVLCGLAGLLIFLDLQGLLGPTRSIVQQGLAPVAGQLTGLRNGVADALSAPRSAAALEARIAELERENARLHDEVLRREQAAVENVFLRQQLNITRTAPWTLLGAEVTVRHPDAGRRIFTIARGANDGVQVGMAVIGQQPGNPAALVGIVERVGPRTADILMMTDIGSRISARVLHDSDSALGMVHGQWQLGSRLRLEQVDRTATVAVGDTVVTAGLTAALDLPLDLQAVPPNVPIGAVERVQADGQQLAADLRPFVDPDQVRYVWVILNQDG